MSVIGRTWRRAPRFRLLVVFAVACSALATMFPPPLPTRHAILPGSGGPPPTPSAHYKPVPPPAPLDYSTVNLPPLNTPRTQLMAFAGRQVPLPVGRWTELALLRSGGPLALQGAVFARMQDGQLSGLLMVVSTPPVETADMRTQPSNGCADPTGAPMHQLAGNGADPAVQECWLTRALGAGGLDKLSGRDPLLKRALGRLRDIDVGLPGSVVLANYVRTDDAGGLDVRLYLPGDGSTAQHRVELWMRRWVPLLHRGFSAGLQPQDMRAGLARDPAAPD